jgi:predicted nucleic acid-binding protein
MNDYFDIGTLERVRIDNAINIALDVEIDLSLNSCDAIHVASAIVNGCDILWSEDEHHTKRKTRDYLKRFNVEVRSLKDIDD